MDSIIKDIQFGVRMLLKNRAFTAVAVLSLALGIGANTAVFQLLNAVRLKNLPIRNVEEVAQIRLRESSAVPTPLFALEVHVGSVPGPPVAGRPARPAGSLTGS